MFSRKLALAIALAMTVTTTSAVAQTAAPPPESRASVDREASSDLLLILGAIIAAGLITFLATQVGGGDVDEPASP